MASSPIIISEQDNIARKFGEALASLGEKKARLVLARTLNHEGAKASTAVKRALQAQTSIPRAIIVRSMRDTKGAGKGRGALEYVIKGRGEPLTLKFFRPTQNDVGTTALVWGRRQTFVTAFMGPEPGVIAPRLDGHVFHRRFARRIPIKRSWGPSVPVEMLKDQSAAAFETASHGIAKRAAHEIARELAKG